MPPTPFVKLASAISTRASKAAKILPSSCALCGLQLSTESGLVCADCYQDFFRGAVARCHQCALPLTIDTNRNPADTALRCGECLANPPSFDHTIVACNYGAPVDQLVLALKFAHQLMLAPLMANLLRDAILREPEGNLPALLIAVPLGPQRLIDRGFNQSVEIGRPLSRQLGIPFIADMMERSRDTAQQSSLHPDARHKNVRNAFIPNAHLVEQIRDKHIGIVDDVMTTGTTMNELANVLKRFGASRISNYVFARTLPH